MSNAIPNCSCTHLFAKATLTSLPKPPVPLLAGRAGPSWLPTAASLALLTALACAADATLPAGGGPGCAQRLSACCLQALLPCAYCCG